MNPSKTLAEAPRFMQSDELRVVDGPSGRPRIVGYAAKYNSLSGDLGGFREQIAPGAFADALSANEEVLALMNHDPKLILGRRSAGTLTLRSDNIGLFVEIDPPNTTVGNDAIENVRRKDIQGMSFRFPRGAKDSWSLGNGGDSIRTLHRIGLLEVTLTPIPAYADTSASLRNLPAQDDELRDYYAAKIAALKPAVPPTARNLAEQRIRLEEAELRCGCDYADPMQPDPADAVRYVLYSCRSVFDSATAALDVLSDLGDDVDADLMRACADAAKAAGDCQKRLKEFVAACGAVKMPDAAAAAAATADAAAA